MAFEILMGRIGDPGLGSSIHWWGGFSVEADGSFDQQGDIVRYDGFTMLHPGDRLRLSTSLHPWGYVDLCSPITPAPFGSVSSATLFFDVEYVVPAERSTWGRIKATYE